MSIYPYATGDLLSERNSYFYSPYDGVNFLKSWSIYRLKVKDMLPPEADVPEPDAVASYDHFQKLIAENKKINTFSLLETLYSFLVAKGEIPGAVVGIIDLMVQRFEVTKRIHEEYGQRFRPMNLEAYNDLELYVRAAEVYEATYSRIHGLPYLNVLIKIVDTLCAINERLNHGQKVRLSRLITVEHFHCQQLGRSAGVEF